MGRKPIYDRYDALRFIVTYKRERDGNSPSFREIAEELKINSTSTVQRILNYLQEEGHITVNGERQIETKEGKWDVYPKDIVQWMKMF